jgi:hypothetical protein
LRQPAQPASRACRTLRAPTLFLFAFLFVTAPLRTFGAEQSNPQNVVMPVMGGKIEITLPDEPMKVSSKDLLDWVKSAADTVSHYYGRFPIPRLTLRIRAGNGSGIRHGVTYARGGGLILIAVGRETEIADLKDDWALTHEMIHLAFPSMSNNHHWIEEGLSTYVEPVARAQMGRIPVAAVWKEFIRDMPKGQPASGDEGLDHTRTWGRTYWGGALFCLVADVQIRERTQNRMGLQDALRAILNHGGVITQDWEIEKTLAIGDEATGTSVLRSLYKEMRDKPVSVDLAQLWQKLGVALRDDQVTFNEKAVDAAIRQAMVSASASGSPVRRGEAVNLSRPR